MSAFDFRDWESPRRESALDVCGNRYCHKCKPLPWFHVTRTRVVQEVRTDLVQAPSAELAIAMPFTDALMQDRDSSSMILTEADPIVASFVPREGSGSIQRSDVERFQICWFEQPRRSHLGWRTGDLTSWMGMIRGMKERGEEVPPEIQKFDEDIPANRSRIEAALVEQDRSDAEMVEAWDRGERG